MLKWYIIHTTPGYENKVRERLIAKIAEKSLQESFGEALAPTEEIEELKMGKKVVSHKRLYPGYLFLQMDFNDDTWHLVRKLQNVTGFVGGGAKPSPLKDSEIANIRAQTDPTKTKPKPKVQFTIGEPVRIKTGPFAEFSGLVDSTDYDKGKLRVRITVFGRETPVELMMSDVTKDI